MAVRVPMTMRMRRGVTARRGVVMLRRVRVVVRMQVHAGPVCHRWSRVRATDSDGQVMPLRRSQPLSPLLTCLIVAARLAADGDVEFLDRLADGLRRPR